MKKQTTPAITGSEYGSFIQKLKERVASARLVVRWAVNRELILLYWDIGWVIAEKQKTLGWGAVYAENFNTT